MTRSGYDRVYGSTVQARFFVREDGRLRFKIISSVRIHEGGRFLRGWDIRTLTSFTGECDLDQLDFALVDDERKTRLVERGKRYVHFCRGFHHVTVRGWARLSPDGKLPPADGEFLWLERPSPAIACDRYAKSVASVHSTY